jgi:hypothetical protein
MAQVAAGTNPRAWTSIAFMRMTRAGGLAALALAGLCGCAGELGPGGRVRWLRHANVPPTGRDIDVKAAAGATVRIEIGLGTPWTVLLAQR